MMKIFQVFSGRKKKDENEYIEFLVGELENLKRENEETVGKKDDQIEKLKSELEKQKIEIDKLQHQIGQEHKEKQGSFKNDQETEKLRAKLQEYEDSYDAFSLIIQKTKMECRKNIQDSKKEAEQITLDAKTEATEILLTAKEEAKKITDKYKMEYTAKWNNLQKCVNSLNGMYKDLERLYSKFGDFIQELSLVIEKVSDNEIIESPFKDEKEKIQENDI